MKDKSMELDGQDKAWEAHLAAAWRMDGNAVGGVAESAALARRLDAALRRERTERRAKRWRVRLAWGAAAACAALLALAAVRGGRGIAGGEAVEVAMAESGEEVSVAEEREAPVAEAFEALDDMLWEMASLTLSYGWEDDDVESIN